jgi:hypothetical protein
MPKTPDAHHTHVRSCRPVTKERCEHGDTRAEHGRGSGGVKTIRNRKGAPPVDADASGIAPRNPERNISRLLAKLIASRPALVTDLTETGQRTYPHTPAEHSIRYQAANGAEFPHDLVPGHERVGREPGRRVVDEVQVRMAHTAVRDLHLHVEGPQGWGDVFIRSQALAWSHGGIRGDGGIGSLAPVQHGRLFMHIDLLRNGDAPFDAPDCMSVRLAGG